jgi:hypothetical protein
MCSIGDHHTPSSVTSMVGGNDGGGRDTSGERWNTDARYPDGPGSSAEEGLVYGAVNWLVKVLRGTR